MRQKPAERLFPEAQGRRGTSYSRRDSELFHHEKKQGRSTLTKYVYDVTRQSDDHSERVLFPELLTCILFPLQFEAIWGERVHWK